LQPIEYYHHPLQYKFVVDFKSYEPFVVSNG